MGRQDPGEAATSRGVTNNLARGVDVAQRTCSEDACENSPVARGICGKHYQRRAKAGTLPPKIKVRAERCEVDGCAGKVRYGGLCATHYRHRKAEGRSCAAPGCDGGGLTRGLCRAHYVEAALASAPPCGESECELPTWAKGLCSKHYKAARIAVQPDCSVDGCGRPTFAKGLCVTHREQLRRLGFIVPDRLTCARCGDVVSRFAQRLPANSVQCRPCREATKRSNWAMTVHELAVRDGTTCRFCAGPVDMALTSGPMRPSVDHILPRSLGGNDEPANLQLLHLRCNIRKSNRVSG